MLFFGNEEVSDRMYYIGYPLIFSGIYLLIVMFVIKLLWGTTRYCRSTSRLFGKTVIITGGNAGIGKETALDLARRGARVILACRNLNKAKLAAQEIKDQTGNYNVDYQYLDLSDLTSVRKFAEHINGSEPRLDILINNAGIASESENGLSLTSQRFDLIFGTNYVGHFLLTYLLLDLLKISSSARIINVSSFMHKMHWTPLNFDAGPNREGMRYPNLCQYRCSKLANIMHARELAKRLAGTGVTANSLHPGVINSEIWVPMKSKWSCLVFFLWKFVLRYLCLDNRGGAQTSIFLAVDEGVMSISGKYFSRSVVCGENKLARDDAACERLWNASLDMCGLSQ
ncbi:retinol dehydrogenase 12-like [Ylistrum balloti]|uniref:retinol dehydrogenase 12-like n=1 Tax=Ylistrum balloti TaxID=509963 RepID=UPI002905883F|nr:retinol dehydrogenase 12-like [Ylistrum balloti]